MPNNTVITFSGRLVDPFNLRLGEIFIEDIAHSLSQLCRYGGHTRIFYSVAQHSVILAAEAKRRWGAPEAMYLLLHDAEEAYLLDLPRPIKKRAEFLHYRKACDRVAAVIRAKFHLTDFTPSRVEEMMELDSEMVAHEAGSLFLVPDEWAKELQSVTQTFFPRIECQPPQTAEVSFLRAFDLYHDDISRDWGG